jgi:hypothetical protein
MHKTTITITAIIIGVLLFLGASGIGLGADDISGFIFSSPFGFMNHELFDNRELYLIDNFFINSVNDW